MNYCFILATVEGREKFLDRCVASAKASRYADADFYLYYQGSGKCEHEDFFREVVYDPQKRGVFTPRFELMKRFGTKYDFTIVIDDDLYLTEDTNYETAMNFATMIHDVGCVCLIKSKDAVKPMVRRIHYGHENYNVFGGLVIPKRPLEEMLWFLRDKTEDYTDDVFWLALYVLGYDLYKDFSSYSVHAANQKVSGKNSGWHEWRDSQKGKEKHLLEGYVDYSDVGAYDVPEVWNVTEAGLEMRMSRREKLFG